MNIKLMAKLVSLKVNVLGKQDKNLCQVTHRLVCIVINIEDFKSEPLHVSNDAACRMDFVLEQSHRDVPGKRIGESREQSV